MKLSCVFESNEILARTITQSVVIISDSKYNIEHLKRVCTFIGKKEMVVTFFPLLKFVQL